MDEIQALTARVTELESTLTEMVELFKSVQTVLKQHGDSLNSIKAIEKHNIDTLEAIVKRLNGK